MSVCPELSSPKPLDQSKNVTIRSYYKLSKDQNGQTKLPKIDSSRCPWSFRHWDQIFEEVQYTQVWIMKFPLPYQLLVFSWFSVKPSQEICYLFRFYWESSKNWKLIRKKKRKLHIYIALLIYLGVCEGFLKVDFILL